MRRFFLLFLAAAPLGAESLPSFLSENAAVTLDDEAFAAVRQEMKIGKPVTQETPPAEEPAAAWRAAMNAPSPEERAVRLLLLLSALNPDFPPAEHALLYIEALQLHTRALAGDAAACRVLSAALRGAAQPGMLALPQDAASAEKLTQRSAF